MPALIVKVRDPRFDDAINSGRLKHIILVFTIPMGVKEKYHYYYLVLLFIAKPTLEGHPSSEKK